jgi:hypothetical protein
MKATKKPIEEYVINLELTSSEARALKALFGQMSKNEIKKYLEDAKDYDDKVDVETNLTTIHFILDEIL